MWLSFLSDIKAVYNDAIVAKKKTNFQCSVTNNNKTTTISASDAPICITKFLIIMKLDECKPLAASYILEAIGIV